MNNELPVQMHPRYPEFLKFMQPCPHRKTPETMQTAFWAWLEKEIECFFIEKHDLCNNQIASLKADLDRLHRERDNFQQQCSAMAEENSRLEARIKTLENVLDEPCTSVDNANIAIGGGY